MKRFTIFVAHNRAATERKVFAASAAKARWICANENGVWFGDCVAIVDDGGL